MQHKYMKTLRLVDICNVDPQIHAGRHLQCRPIDKKGFAIRNDK
jgi:hypothetical protein